MNAALVANWNSAVNAGDTVYHLGDFGTMESLDYLSQLNGNIIFLPGNYETPEMMEVLSKTCEIIQPNTVIEVDGHRFQLVHGGIFAVHVIPNRRIGHCLAHGRGWPANGIRAEVDSIHSLKFT